MKDKESNHLAVPEAIAAGDPKRTWGLRFSISDAIVLALLACSTVVVYQINESFAWLVGIASMHFFLFCNVFRVRRRREIIWAVLFVLNAGFWFLLGRINWFAVLACQIPVTAGVIAWEIKTPRYHGIFANRLNPRLEDYLERRIL